MERVVVNFPSPPDFSSVLVRVVLEVHSEGHMNTADFNAVGMHDDRRSVGGRAPRPGRRRFPPGGEELGVAGERLKLVRRADGSST